MVYVKINEVLYPATISGRVQDTSWDNRESKAITLEGDYNTVNALLTDGTPWSIVQEDIVPVVDENGNESTETKQTEYDNFDFCIRGDLTVHTDGTCTVKMGKLTDLEEAYEIMFGGND